MSTAHDTPDPLLDALRDVTAKVDPVPAAVTEFARLALGLRTIDAELAELVYDSATDAELATAVRGGESARMLSFAAGAVSVELEVTVAGEVRDLVGQLVPPQAATIEIRHRDGSVEVAADDLGRFAAPGIAAGPVSLQLRLLAVPHATPVTTEWLPL
jgi:hypothetical protein